MKNIFYFLISIITLLAMIFFKDNIASSLEYSINYCLKILIPSLFPLIFLASFISVSPAKNVLEFSFSFFCKRILKLPKSFSSAFILGLFCGYPVGAKLTANLLENKKINTKQANRILTFCVNSGIPFAVLFVGGFVFSSIFLGFLMFISLTIASLIIAIFTAIKEEKQIETIEEKEDFNFNSSLQISAKNALSGTVNLCLYVLIFSVFICIFQSSGIFQTIINQAAKTKIFTAQECNCLMMFLLDVTKGVSTAQVLSVSSDIFVLGLSFAGLCVHFQVFSFFPKNTVNYKMFYISRIIHAFLSLEIFKILKMFFPNEVSVFSSIQNFTPQVTATTATGSIFLIILSGFYVYKNQ